MSFRIGSLHRVVPVGVLLFAALPAAGQIGYPSFQTPRVANREFNFALADADGVTPIMFQWREGTSVRSQISLDVGLADPESDAADLFFLIGGQYAHQLARSTTDMPLDLLLTVGVFGIFGNDATGISVPVGLSVGHRFPLEGTRMAITPYAHPRLSLDYVDSDPGDSETDLEINFDLGGSLEISPQIAIRLSALLGDPDALGISLAWTPSGLRSSPARPAVGSASITSRP